MHKTVARECPEKERLLVVYRKGAALYSLAVKQLAQSRPTASREAYEDLRRLSDLARKDCERDRLELEKHVDSHGC
jgi:hypothetical protein